MKEIVEIKFCVWCISISLIQGKRRQVCNKGIFKCVVAECMRTWKAWVFLIGKGFTDLISCYIKSFECRAWTKCSKSYIYRLLIKLLTLFHHLRLKRRVEKVLFYYLFIFIFIKNYQTLNITHMGGAYIEINLH